MGDVYQATDLKLKRSVAIKLLPDAFASDPDRLSRFRREAQLLASLNHPNIAHIYGLEESGDKRCIVMELVEGETLQSRIKRGPLPVDEVLTIAKQIAEALEAAHEKGVIHRDLKPGNVMLTGEGKVKVLDFGLAKAYEANPSNTSLSNSPTMASMAATNAGVILGTAAYMSPEQAKGRTVDKRTDIFAFGCVLYEMLTAKPAFDGEDTAEILSSVLKSEPVWTKLPVGVPARIHELLRLCLEKNVKNRRSDATDVRLDIEQAQKEKDSATVLPTVSVRNARLPWVFTTVALMAAVGMSIAYFRARPLQPPQIRVDITTPAGTSGFALSPDGQNLVFVAPNNGKPQVWLRPMDSTSAQPLPGTEGANAYLFWSPDSRSIGFFASAKLKRLDIGGTPQVLADAVAGRGGAWNTDGSILYSPVASGLLLIRASGGQPEVVTTQGRLPQFLPDNRRFLYYVDGQGIFLASLSGGAPKRLAESDSAAAFMNPDRVFFVRHGALLSQRLDLKRNELMGDPETVAGQVRYNPFGYASLSISSGRIAYRAGANEGPRRRFKWLDRSGKPLAPELEPIGNAAYPDLSPDNQFVAFNRDMDSNRDVWLWDLLRGGLTRFTFDPSIDAVPVWSPDGAQIAFASNRKGHWDLFVRPSDGSQPEQLLLQSDGTKNPDSWSSDGKFLLY